MGGLPNLEMRQFCIKLNTRGIKKTCFLDWYYTPEVSMTRDILVLFGLNPTVSKKQHFCCYHGYATVHVFAIQWALIQI